IKLGGKRMGVHGRREGVDGRSAGRGGAEARQSLHAVTDLLLAAKQEQRPPQADAITRTQPAYLDHVAVDPRAACALQGRPNDLAVVELHLGVEATDALIVEAQHVAFYPAERDRSRQITENASLVDPFEDSKGYQRHRRSPGTRSRTKVARPREVVRQRESPC